jgi:hypothetical protein
MNAQSVASSQINKLYQNLTYMDYYGGSVFVFVMVTLVVLLVVGFCHTMKEAEQIRADWVNQRCSPFVIPFAGFINKNPDQGVLEFTESNFQYCIQNITQQLTSYAVEPITFLTSTLTVMYQTLANNFNDIRNIISNVRSNIANIYVEIYGRIANIMIPYQVIMIKLMDVFHKINGILTAGLYTVFGAYMALQSLIGVIIKVIIFFLIIAAGVIVAAWIAMFFSPALLATFLYPVIAATATFAVVAAMITTVIVISNETLHMNNQSKVPGVPSRPSCFAPETMVRMQDGSQRCISELEVGDVLWPTNRVTARLVLDGRGSTMYQIGSVVVSGSHRVRGETGKWVYVKDDPRAKRIDRVCPLLYCLNTESKRIELGDETKLLFCDWDEIFEEEERKLFRYMPRTKQKREYIGMYFDAGWPVDTMLLMKNGVRKPIQEVQVGDVLERNVVVEGIVQLGDNTLGVAMYNLLTNQQHYYVNEEKYADYNSCIESFL